MGKRDSESSGRAPAELFGAALVEVEGELDWERLGRAYCHEGGEHFFGPGDREALRDAGLLFAGELGERLHAGGASLYLGAALAELAPILCEALVLGREVRVRNLPGPEMDELGRALSRVGEQLGVPLPRFVTSGLEAAGAADCDHGWCVSVLTDPGAFPALHDLLYERTGDAATGRGDPDEERVRAEALVARFLDHLRTPCALTTTDEELGFFERECARRGLVLRVPERARLSPIVGDPVRFCRLEARR